MGQGGGIAGVMKLTEHFGVRNTLRRKRGGKGEEMTQQDRLGNPAHLQHVAGKHGFDE